MSNIPSDLAEYLDQKFAQIDERLKQIDLRFEQIDRRFDQIDLQFEQIDRRFDQIDLRFEQIDRRFEHVDSRLEQSEGNMSQLPTKAYLDDKIASLVGPFTAMLRKVDHKTDRLTGILKDKKILNAKDTAELKKLQIFSAN